SIRNSRHLAQTEGLVAHTHEVVAQLEAVLSTLKDAETGQRGYLLTGDERYLDPYEKGVANVRDRLMKVKALTADNLVQSRHVEALEKLTDDKFEELRRTVNAFRSAQDK